MDKLIIVKQLPIIEEQLKALSVEIDKKVDNALSLVCTEDTYKDVKKVRAELNKQFAELEEQRKEVKTAILAPYNEFENIYKEYVSNKFKTADIDIKAKVTEVEQGLKEEKQQNVIAYFNEYKTAKNVDFLKFKDSSIIITLSASVKSLKEQVKSFVDKVCNDIDLIGTHTHKEEILVEYHKTLNVSSSITTVNERIKQIELQKQLEIERQEAIAVEKEHIQKIDKLAAPVVKVKIPKDEMLEVSFKVRATREKLKKLKQFLIDGGYDYE